jgi:hypothetical protein
LKKFIFATDLHYGYERKNGHKVALHDPKALNVLLKFAADFKPDVFIYGGDILDCGCISHHNHGKPGATEGLKLIQDGRECRKAAIEPIEKLLPNAEKVYIIGNHEDWLTDLTDQIPTLEGLVDLDAVLKLDKWKIIPQGGSYNLGKLTFVHGDQLKGGESVAKNAVIAYERSVRFGHVHTFSSYTKTSALDYKYGKTGIAVPCLCSRTPKYGEGAPNRWMQGFNFGYVNSDGTFSDYVPIITNGQFIHGGKLYKG